MNKKELFLLAMKSEEYRRKAFVISAFSIFDESSDAWKKNPYPYRIIQTKTGYFFVDPDNNNELTIIEDAIVGEALYGIKEKVSVTIAVGITNLNSDIETTYGKILFNYIVLIHAFKNKIPYINTRISPDKVEDLIIGRLKDNPLKEEDRNETDIYIDEYLLFTKAMFFLAGFTQICVPAASAKTITAAPGIVALKERLLAENKDRLHDPAIIALIDAELVKFDKAYMAGDIGEGFLIGGKAYNIVRKKLFSMHGAEMGLEEKVDVNIIQNSLSQGWDISKMPEMINSLRAGSFNRGSQTMLGGEAVKWLYRASSNMNVTEDDCGSKLGNVINVTENNIWWLKGFSVVTETGSDLVDSDEKAKSYIGKKVMVRSPMYCKLDKTDFCKVCVGSNLANNPTGLSVAVSEFGSAILSLFMKASHGKALTVAHMDYMTAIQ